MKKSSRDEWLQAAWFMLAVAVIGTIALIAFVLSSPVGSP